MSTTLNLGVFDPATRAMGPGLRACLWMRGCSIKCPGCGTPELIPSEPREIVSVDTARDWITDAQAWQPLEGVSFSGGEPFEQAAALTPVAQHARYLGLSTLAWSGYTRGTLEGSDAPHGSADLLAALDVLIDGPFVRSEATSEQPLRGSRNQRIHLLTERYTPRDFMDAVIEVRRERGGLRIIGVTDYEAVRAACAALATAGR